MTQRLIHKPIVSLHIHAFTLKFFSLLLINIYDLINRPTFLKVAHFSTHPRTREGGRESAHANTHTREREGGRESACALCTPKLFIMDLKTYN